MVSMNVIKIDESIYEIPPKTLMARVEGKIAKFQMKVPVCIYAYNLCIKNSDNFGLSAGIFVHTKTYKEI